MGCSGKSISCVFGRCPWTMSNKSPKKNPGKSLISKISLPFGPILAGNLLASSNLDGQPLRTWS